jgi:hypothetical protein
LGWSWKRSRIKKEKAVSSFCYAGGDQNEHFRTDRLFRHMYNAGDSDETPRPIQFASWRRSPPSDEEKQKTSFQERNIFHSCHSAARPPKNSNAATVDLCDWPALVLGLSFSVAGRSMAVAAAFWIVSFFLDRTGSLAPCPKEGGLGGQMAFVVVQRFFLNMGVAGRPCRKWRFGRYSIKRKRV